MMRVIKIKSQVYGNLNTYMQLKKITILIRMLIIYARHAEHFSISGLHSKFIFTGTVSRTYRFILII